MTCLQCFLTLIVLIVTLISSPLAQPIDPQSCTISPTCESSEGEIIRACAAQPNAVPQCSDLCSAAIRGYLENFNCGPERTFSLFFQPALANPRIVNSFIACGYAIQLNMSIDADPLVSLNVLYQQLGQHYPFMCQNSVDWAQSYWNTRPGVSEYTQPDELYDIMDLSLRPLVDASVTLLQFDISQNPPGLSRMRRGGSLPAWAGIGVPPLWLNTIDSRYLGMSMEAIPGILSYGVISRNPSIGYIRILSFPTPSPNWDGSWDRMANFLSGGRAIIVDVRFNQGGDDRSAASAASRFADRRTAGIRRRTRIPSFFTGCCRFDYAPFQTLCLQPTFLNFVGKEVVVLTSAGTLGSAEAFVMMMRGLPGCRVTIIGEKTQGAPSDVLFFRLPNGWLGSFPHKIYYDRDGRIYQQRGIAPDQIVAFDPLTYANGTDTVLDSAINYLSAPRFSPCKSCAAEIML